MRPIRVFAATAVGALVIGCAGGARGPEEDDTEPLRRRAGHVQAVACILPATEARCDAALSATTRDGTIACLDGRPHALFSSDGKVVDGDFPAPIWEAIWRVLVATGSCVQAYGAPVQVKRGGDVRSCPSSAFDATRLFDAARALAVQGPPSSVHLVHAAPYETTSGMSLCAEGTRACPVPSPCPAFAGDVWNGVTRAPAKEVDAGVLADADAGPAPREARPARPSQGAVTEALGRLIPAARRCVRDTDPPARADVVFAPDGTVASVAVKANGKGKPNEACIAGVLDGARVPPFDGPPYTVTLTVRP